MSCAAAMLLHVSFLKIVAYRVEKQFRGDFFSVPYDMEELQTVVREESKRLNLQRLRYIHMS